MTVEKRLKPETTVFGTAGEVANMIQVLKEWRSAPLADNPDPYRERINRAINALRLHVLEKVEAAYVPEREFKVRANVVTPREVNVAAADLADARSKGRRELQRICPDSIACLNVRAEENEDEEIVDTKEIKED